MALVCGNATVAEDAVEEALARAWERSERGEDIRSLPAWVLTVALNLVRSGSSPPPSAPPSPHTYRCPGAPSLFTVYGNVPGLCPTPTPAVTPSASIAPRLPAACDESWVTGRFYGNTRLDLAVVAREACLGPSASMHPPPGDPYEILVHWGSGAEGIWPATECHTACRLIAAADLDSNGTDEALLEVDGPPTASQPAALISFEALELFPSEAGPVQFAVAPPGEGVFKAGRAAIFEFGSGSGTQLSLKCSPHEGVSPPTSTVVASRAAPSPNGNRWVMTEALFSLSYVYNRDVSKLRGRLALAFIPAGMKTESFSGSDPRLRQFMAGYRICGGSVYMGG